MTPTRNPVQLPLDLPHRPAQGGEDFLVASNNAEAVAWLDRWPDWPAPALVLFGPPGCGKSHLAQVFAERARASVLAARSLRHLDLSDVSASGRPVVVEDADRGVDEAALFHLYNLLREAGAHLLLTARSAPARWPLVLSDVKSRLVASPHVAIGAPDDALMAAVLVKLFADRQIRITQEAVTYLLARMERSFAAARALTAAADRLALAKKRRAVTVPLLREALAETVPGFASGPDAL